MSHLSASVAEWLQYLHGQWKDQALSRSLTVCLEQVSIVPVGNAVEEPGFESWFCHLSLICML